MMFVTPAFPETLIGIGAGGLGSWYGVRHSALCVTVRTRDDVIHARALTHTVQCARLGLETL